MTVSSFPCLLDSIIGHGHDYVNIFLQAKANKTTITDVNLWISLYKFLVMIDKCGIIRVVKKIKMMAYKRVNNNRPDRGKNRKAGNDPRITAEMRQDLLAKELRIRPKTKALYDEVINNPKITQREAYLRTHKTNNIKTADVEASKLLNSPKYSIYRASAVGSAKRRIVQLVKSNNESIALKASQDILDRTEGKAVQKTENTSKVVEVKLDLSGVRIGAHYMPAIAQNVLDMSTDTSEE